MARLSPSGADVTAHFRQRGAKQVVRKHIALLLSRRCVANARHGDSILILLYGVTLLAGICSAIEPGQNATLAKALGQPWIAALVLLLTNAIIFIVAGLCIGGLSLPSLEQVQRAPWWAWLGGLTSAVIIVAQLFISEKIGAGRFLGLIVTAGVVTSILLDNYGLDGFQKHPASWLRLGGGVLMIVGVGLVSLF